MGNHLKASWVANSGGAREVEPASENILDNVLSSLRCSSFSMQLPTGLLADKWGGSLLMTMSLVSWCFASLLMPFAAVVPGKLVFYFIFLERFLLGLFQSGIVTSTAAMSSK